MCTNYTCVNSQQKIGSLRLLGGTMKFQYQSHKFYFINCYVLFHFISALNFNLHFLYFWLFKGLKIMTHNETKIYFEEYYFD